ncbi:RluA family pseudouridine synthase [Candidatus Peregrinibacteria bacterium]|nr:RluA family pseudouridine synthase [Candidatus Peregrinibacteria bacterium]
MPIDPKRILYKDDQFLAVHKLSGELSVKGKGAVDKLPLHDFLRKEFPGIRPVNRLDFETSGVMLFARTREALEAVMPPSRKFNAHSLSSRKPPTPLPPSPDGGGGTEGGEGWKKTYRTVVAGRLTKDHGAIHFPLPARNNKDTVPAHTAYRVLERYPDCTYIEAEIATGRHHQIRRHFQKIGHPLVLDQIYGDKKFNAAFSKAHRYRKFFLHAYSVEFVQPFTKEAVKINAPMPKVFEELLKKLRG